jgi:hypothetical protein
MFSTRRTRLTIGVIMLSLLAGSAAGSAQAATLIGRAVVPADTFSVGPTSGQFISAANGRVPPFLRHQPVQGFSAVLRAEDGGYLAMPDNGFGAKANSADFVLAVYRLTPDFATRLRGTGTIGVTLHYNLRDPDHRIGFRIVADGDTYPGSAIPVDPSIRQGRLVTGADFDIESFRLAPDGTFWFGDEFGPFLIHTDDTGRVLEAPISLPGVRSPTTRSRVPRRICRAARVSRAWRSVRTADSSTPSWRGPSPPIRISGGSSSTSSIRTGAHSPGSSGSTGWRPPRRPASRSVT